VFSPQTTRLDLDSIAPVQLQTQSYLTQVNGLKKKMKKSWTHERKKETSRHACFTLHFVVVIT
jgi:hypothetical protein